MGVEVVQKGEERAIGPPPAQPVEERVVGSPGAAGLKADPLLVVDSCRNYRMFSRTQLPGTVRLRRARADSA